MIEIEQTELEASLGYHFLRRELLECALTHSSLRPELDAGGASHEEAEKARQDNEKLEFLGDAILGALVSEYLVTSFPEWNEGQLSKRRANLVRAASLHAAARRLDLGHYLRLGRGEEKTGGRDKPAVLADAYEAIVAAIYLDAGLDAARRFVHRTLLADAGELAGKPELTDYKSAFQELLQARGLPPAEYCVVSESGPDHRKMFVVEARLLGRAVASGAGANKKEADQAAARLALKQFASREGKG